LKYVGVDVAKDSLEVADTSGSDIFGRKRWSGICHPTSVSLQLFLYRSLNPLTNCHSCRDSGDVKKWGAFEDMDHYGLLRSDYSG